MPYRAIGLVFFACLASTQRKHIKKTKRILVFVGHLVIALSVLRKPLEANMSTSQLRPSIFSISAAAFEINVSRSTLYRMAKAGRIRIVKINENIDYLEFSPNLVKTSKCGRPTKEYHITLDMAKELSI